MATSFRAATLTWVDFNLVIAGTGKKLLADSIRLNNNGTEGKAPATCTETGYNYYSAKISITSNNGTDFAWTSPYTGSVSATSGTLNFGNNKIINSGSPAYYLKNDSVSNTQSATVYETLTKDERYKTKDNTEDVKSHDYDVKFVSGTDTASASKEEWTYGPAFEELNGVAIEDDNENPVYTTTLECKRNGCLEKAKDHELVVEGAISLTKGDAVTYTTDNGTYQTKTTEVKMYKDINNDGKYSEGTDVEIDCQTTGDYYRLTFDILDGNNKVLISGLTINYFTPIAKGTHSYATVKDTTKFNPASGYRGNFNLKTYWVYEKNGEEIEVEVPNANDGVLTYNPTTYDPSNPNRDPAPKELIEFAKEHEGALVVRTYAFCTGADSTGTLCGEKQLVNEQTIKATTAVPTAENVGKLGTPNTWYAVTDGQYELAGEYKFDYYDVQAKKDGEDTLKSKVVKTPTTAAVDGDPESAVVNQNYNPGVAGMATGYEFAAGTFDINDSNLQSKAYVVNPDEFNEGVIALTFKTGYNIFLDTDRDGKKADADTTIAGGTTFYQVIPAETDDSKHTWTLVDTATGTAKAPDAATTKTFGNYHFEGKQATASADGEDGFDLYYCAYKNSAGNTTYQFALSYGKNGPEGEPESKDGIISGSVKINNNTNVNATTTTAWVFGKEGDKDNNHEASHWVYVPVQEDKVDVAAVSTTGNVGILGVAYKAQYDDNGVMKDTTSTGIVVYYRPKQVGQGTGWTNAKGENIGTTLFPEGGRTPVPAMYGVVKENPEDVDCDGFVKYTGLNEGLDYNFAEDTYVFTSVEPGRKHASITGTVTWKTEGSATVKLVCDKCKTEQKEDVENLKVKRGEVVEPTCLEDGYTEYKATYKGLLEGVTLVNDTYKGSPRPALGHEVNETSKLNVWKDGDNYVGQVYCTRCEEYHDDVVSIEGPTVENDKSRTVKVNYTNGLAEYDAKGVKNGNYQGPKDGLTQTLTLIDGVEPGLAISESAGAYTVVYGAVTDYAVVNGMFKDLELENGDVLTTTSITDKSDSKKVYQSSDSKATDYNEKAVPLSVTVTDSEGKEIKAPRREADGKALPVGSYTLTITGLQTGIKSNKDNSTFNYTGQINKTIEVVEKAAVDYTLVDQVDGEDGASTTITYDGKAHTYKTPAYVTANDGVKYKNVDKNVTVSYTLDGKDVDESALSFTEAGTYKIVVTAKKAGFKDQTKKVNFIIRPVEVTAAIDNATMVEGNAPEIKYTLSSKDMKELDEKEMGFKITSSGGDDLTKLIPGKYDLKGEATNKNYNVTTKGYDITGGNAPTLTVVANDGSSQEDQALASAAAKKINDLTDESSAADVQAARAAYDALSAKAKARVDSATVAKLVAQEDRVAAEAVIDQLNKANTDAEKAAAYDAYNKLSANAKAKVEAAAKDKLAAAKTAYEAKQAAEKAAADKAAADPVIATLTGINANSSESAAKAALDAYNKLTADQKALVAANPAAKAGLDAASKIVNKKPGKVTIKTKKKSIKASKLTKKAKSFKISYKRLGKGKVTFKAGKSTKNRLKLIKGGKIQIKKGTKKGTYKIKVKVSAAADNTYKAASATKTIQVVVKK